MEIIMTPNGVETIFSDRDAVDIIRNYVSDDMADYVERKIVEFDEESYLAEQRWQSDYDAMEQENDEYRDALFEVKSQLEQIVYDAEFTRPGLTKIKILNKLDGIIDQLTKML